MSSQPPTKPESAASQNSPRAEAATLRANAENKRLKREELKQQIQDTLPPHLAALAYEDLNAQKKSDNIATGIAMMIIALALALGGAFLISQATNSKISPMTVDGIAIPKKNKSKKSKTTESPTFAVALNSVHDPNFNKITIEQVKQNGIKRLFDSLDYTKPASVANSLEVLSDDEAINILQQIPGWRLPSVYERLSTHKLASILKVMLATPEWKTMLYAVPAEALKEARTIGAANGSLNTQQQKTIDQALTSGQLPTDKGFPPGYRSPTNPQSLPDNTATPVNTAADQRYAASGTATPTANNATNSNSASAAEAGRYAPSTDRYALP